MASRLLSRATASARAAARRPIAQAVGLCRVAPSALSSTFSTPASSSTADTPELAAHYADLNGFHRDLALAAFRGDVPSTYAASTDNEMCVIGHLESYRCSTSLTIKRTKAAFTKEQERGLVYRNKQ